MPELFDAHCHIAETGTKAAAPSEPAPPVSGRLLCGVAPEDWARIAAAAASWPGSVAAYGLHPWHAARPSGEDWRDVLRQRLRDDPAAWVGEIGLDGLKADAVAPAVQQAAFAWQLRLARDLGRPVNLHCVKAWDQLRALLDAEYRADGAFIVHSFGGPHQAIRPLTERGAYFTVGPLAARRDSPRSRNRAALLPEDRLLLESDEFLVPGRDAGGELLSTLRWLAEARRCDAAALAARIADNCRRLFHHG